MSDLPQGWVMAPLRNYVYFQEGPGLRKWQFADNGIPFLNIRTFNHGKIDKTKCNYVKKDEFNGKYEHFLLSEGDIVVSSSGTIGKVAVIRESDLPLMLNTSVIRFRTLCPDHLTQEFLKYYLQSQTFFRQIDSLKTGSAIFNYGPSHLKEVDIIVPPYGEQCRIVATLEKLLTRVETCKVRLDKIPALLKRFRQSILAAACSGRLTADWHEAHIEDNPVKRTNILANGLPEVPETWCWVKLPKTGEMSRGKSRHRPRNAPFLLGGSYPFIQTGDIAQSGGRITSHKHTYSEAGLAQSRLWPAKTVCITIAANIAESALLTYPACFPDSVVGIITDRSQCLPEFLEFFIRTAKSDLSTFAPATAQKNINIKILSDVLVPLPPLPEQHEIVNRVEALFKIADQIEARYQKAKTYVVKLTQSILAKAFRGELVPEDENDNPSSELLGKRSRRNEEKI